MQAYFFPTRKAHFLPFCEDTDCSIRAPKIAAEKNMTAARPPGIILTDGRRMMEWGGGDECRQAGAKVT